MALEHPWWKKWLCYISCEWFTKPIFGKRFCVCIYDVIGFRKKVKREFKGKDGGFRFFAMPKTLAFIGLDGSGKTTQANNLISFFHTHKIRFSYVHLPSASPLNMISKAAKVKPVDCDPQVSHPSTFRSLVRQKFMILGVFWLYIFRFIPSWILGKPVICDRWFYDELIHLRYKKMSSFTKLYEALIPRPGMLFYLKETPEQAFRRAKEADEGYYRKKYHMYENLAKRRHAKIIKVTTKEETWKRIEKELDVSFGNVYLPHK